MWRAKLQITFSVNLTLNSVKNEYVQSYKLTKESVGLTVREIRSEPGEGGASDAKGGLEKGEENGVIDLVKGSTEVKEDEDIEGASVRG